MDKNQLTGFVLIGLILFGYMFYMQPSEEELKAMQARQDSIAAAQDIQKQAETDSAELTKELSKDEVVASADNNPIEQKDSLVKAEATQRYGSFAKAASGNNSYYTIENELLKVKIASLGGRMVSAELKNYQTYDSLPLLLFNEDSSTFTINFFDQRKSIYTDELFFEADGESFEVTGENSNQLAMRLYAENKDSYIEYLYTLKGNSYQLGFDINVVGLDDVIRNNQDALELNWKIHALSKEKGIDNERMTTTVFYKYKDDEVDYISERSDERNQLEARTHWVSFKQQYFSAAIISESGFDKSNSTIESFNMEGASSKYTKMLATNLTMPFQNGNTIPLTFYLGPNHYQTLKDLDIGLQDQIDLGWTIFGWVNEWIVIPIFNGLDKYTGLNYGIIILLLTIFIKMVLFPLTYKNYKSSAKMKVLKPEIEAIKEKDPMKKQQATMALYKKAGVNPMAGCVPMLLQMPILYAMFRFFPSSIELRQEGFLWADDLSTYDSIYDLGFSIPFYGDHISLFTLLMACSTFLYTKYNMQMTAQAGPQAQQMKIMMYFMPVMLLGFFNSYSAGLSYYYFLANIISVAQQLIIKKWFIDEEAIKKQIAMNKKKPQKQSKFQKRLEEMAKQRGYKPPK